MGTGFRRVVALLFSWLHLVAILASQTDLQPTNTRTGILDQSEDEARKLFAGYRIVPKPCVGTPSSPSARDGAPGICMFNYECSQRNGELVGACMDGFLFGACCKLPPGVSFVVDLPGIDELDINSADSHESHVTPSMSDSTHDLFLPPVLPSFPSAGADTVLLHQNGTEVKDSVQNLQELLFDRPNIQEDHSGPTSRRPELTTFSYVTGPGVPVSTLKHSSTSKSPYFATETSSSPPKPHGVTSPENQSWDNILQSNAIPSDALEKSSSIKPYVTASTTYYTQPPQYTKPSFFTTTTKWHYGQPGFRPKPTTQSNKTPATQTDDGLVQVPLLLASSTNVPESDPNVEAATNAASINHILSLLNNSQPPYLEGSPGPQKNATRPEKPVTKPTKFKPTTPGYSHLEPVLIETTPSKEIPTAAAASHVVTSQSYFTAKKPSTSTTLSIHYTSRPTTSKPTTTTRRPPSSTSTINIHGPSFTVKPKDPVRITTPHPHVTHFSTPKPPLSSHTKKPDPETTFHYRPTPDPSYHYTPSYDYLYSSSTNYPTPPPPPPSGLYGPPPSATGSSPFSTSLYTSPTPSSSLRPPKPSAPPPVPTVIVLGPYDPVSTTYATPTNRPTLSSHTQDSLIGNTGLVYTQIPSNNQGGHVTIITKKPSRPTTTVTKRTPITVATQPVTESAGSTDVFQYVTAYPQTVTLPPALPSENDLVAFPPVRDPNLNVTSKPSYTGEDTEDAQYGTDYTTPYLDEANLDNKVHGFVNKIVQSLQGNFQDLEQVLFNGEKTNITITKPIVFTTTTRRPTILSTVWSTIRPTKPTTKRPPPIKVSKPTTPVVQTSTKKPTTRPLPTTTKRPVSTTRRPKPTTVTTTTKKPKPVRKPTSTTTESYEEEDESTSPYSSSTAVDSAEPDYRRQCGVRPHVKSGRVVGGKGASFGEWPWQVLVRESTWLGLFTKNKCGGVLITHRFVITAAHCQPGFLASLVAVLGEYDISGEVEQKRSVSKNVRRVIVHRQYDAATFENDLALLELESPIQYDTHIVPICMPADHADFTGRMATVTGWGRLTYGGGVPSVLQEVQVPVIENSACQEMFHTSGHAKNIISSFLCAGYVTGQKDSCEGDSGGPLMVEGDDGRWILVGTVSHGIKCAAPYLPGVYMRTTYYKPWLKSITGVQ